MNDNVSKRLVLFLGGFDPRGGRHYYSLFEEHSQKMAEVSGAQIKVSERKRLGKHVTQWFVNYQDSGKPSVQTEFRALNYDDIIRRFWLKSEALIIKKMIITYFLFWRHGFFNNQWRVLKPIIYMGSLFVILSITAALILVSTLIPIWLLTTLPTWLKILSSLIVVILVIIASRFLDKKLNHYWLIRGICFSGGQEQYDDPHYEERMNFFVQQLIEAEQSDNFDEIQIVGHSSGAIWATEIVGRSLLQDKTFGESRTQINILTLGSGIALMSGSTLNKGYHQYLEVLGSTKKVDWLDLSEKIDIGSCYMVNPVELLPTMKKRKSNLPRLGRPLFFKLFTEEAFLKFKKNAYLVHFQFLYSSEKDGNYNYFRWTCGEQPLRQQSSISPKEKQV